MIQKIKNTVIANRDFVRFVIVGIIATIIHYGAYFAFLKLLTSTSIAYSIGYLISLAINFYLTHIFTFKVDISLKRSIAFFSSHAINYVLHLLFLNLYIYIGFTELLAPIPVYATVVPINFLILRYFLKK